MKTYIGIDNGVSGTIGIIRGDDVYCYHTPIRRVLDYQKQAAYLSRINVEVLMALLSPFRQDDIFVALERPMVNPKMFKSTVSALRCFEAQLVVLEALEIPYSYIDSKEWQKILLPKGVKGADLKTASLSVGNRLFPQYIDFKHPDRDGLLIAEYLRVTNK